MTSRLVTPEDFRVQYGNKRGEAFGLSHNFMQIGYSPAAQPPRDAEEPLLRGPEHASRVRAADGADLGGMRDRADP